MVSEQSPPEEVPPELKPSEAALEALEKGMDVETKERFTVRVEEGLYDHEIDELYLVWSKLHLMMRMREEMN